MHSQGELEGTQAWENISIGVSMGLNNPMAMAMWHVTLSQHVTNVETTIVTQWSTSNAQSFCCKTQLLCSGTWYLVYFSNCKMYFNYSKPYLLQFAITSLSIFVLEITYKWLSTVTTSTSIYCYQLSPMVELQLNWATIACTLSLIVIFPRFISII